MTTELRLPLDPEQLVARCNIGQSEQLITTSIHELEKLKTELT